MKTLIKAWLRKYDSLPYRQQDGPLFFMVAGLIVLAVMAMSITIIATVYVWPVGILMWLGLGVFLIYTAVSYVEAISEDEE